MLKRLRRADVRGALIGGVVVLLVVSPALFTSRGYGIDTTNNIWLIWQQGLAIAHGGHPTLFVSTSSAGPSLGVFQPLFAFYGGTLFGVFGALSALLGHRPTVAWALSLAILTAMAYRGVWSIAVQAGARRLDAHLPAFVFTTSAYYLTDAFARGAWTEFAALSTFPFSVAYGLRLLSGPWTARPVAAYAFGVVLFSGSHNISLLWGTLITVVVGIALLAVAGTRRPPLRTLVAFTALTGVAVAVNGWFLVVDLAHSSDVVASELQPMAWVTTQDWDTVGALFNPFRVTPAVSTTFGLTIVAPVLALLAAVLIRVRARRPGADAAAEAEPGAAAERRSLARSWWVLLLGFAALSGLLLMPGGAWDAMPRTLQFIQFPFRLAGWIGLAVALVLAVALGLDRISGVRRPAWLQAALLAVVAITVVQTAAQLYATTDDEKSIRDRNASLAPGPDVLPTSWYDTGFYRDATLPKVPVAPGVSIAFPQPARGSSTTSTVVDLPIVDRPVQTNISGGPWAVRIDLPDGVIVGGRSETDNTLTLGTSKAKPGKARITVTADLGTPGRIGVAMSLLALLALAALIVRLTLQGRRAAPVTA